MTRYATIVADPPWPYPEGFVTVPDRPHLQDRKEGKSHGTITKTELPYDSMSLKEIEAIPVADFALPDARLFLWATSRYLPDALRIASEWGFSYRQLIVWDKTPNIPPFGGSVAPNSAEFLIVAVRGKPPVMNRWTTSVVRARKGRTEHSRKPDVFLDFAETVSSGPYLEMFARRQRLGWDTWGDEALQHVEIEPAA